MTTPRLVELAAKFGDAALIKVLRQRGIGFSVTPDVLQELRKKGVSDAVCKEAQRVAGEQRLKLVDVIVDDAKRFPQIEVKLRNAGPAAYVKRAIFKVALLERFDNMICPSTVPVSMKYDVMLPVQKTPYQVELPLNQGIKSGEFDRFTFVVGNDASVHADPDYLYVLELDLLYDEDNKRVSSGPIALVARPAQRVAASTSCASAAHVYLHDREAFAKVKGFLGTGSAGFERLSKDYAESIAPKLLVEIQQGHDAAAILGQMRFLGVVAAKEREARDALKRLADGDARQYVRDFASQLLRAAETGPR